ncbi:MBOAT family O-acyltransferase [Duganella callida]|uniref:Probable alginate O-acetylase AlgI n=1 Tax=Duganella callida TaxID=2561932 RepID=A0A4Y9S731_9BURK|nr:MBOAT family protein [Duganella callida]TFW17282.1 MBOAT family protein [Duganella callida]
MLFNSFPFLLGYLPVTLLLFFALARRSQAWAAAWLALASLVFYGWWDYRYIPLLLASVGFNYVCGLRCRAAPQPVRKRWLTGAIAVNLLLLAYMKYADFFLASAAALSGRPLPLLHVVLPIGISFYTFTQIAFLVDSYQGKVRESRFIHYLLFVTYFPHLIAGPVLHHKEMMPQFAARRTYAPLAENFAVGSAIFLIGLAKKVLLADNLAAYASPLFAAPDAPSLLPAWGGVLAYAFQLYFDFSGYSDMAIGLSRLFGVRLPLNFNSPYKAANIIDFWRRWHMTLSRFLRDYLYLPLGGNRKGPLRRHVNLMTTMLLGGLWHGAGWNFVIWGGLHGLYLTVNHGWLALATRLGFPLQARLWRWLAAALTFVAVCYAWVFFRASDTATALDIVRGMSGLHGLALPDAIGNRLGPARLWLEQLGMGFFAGGGARFIETWSWVLLAALLAFACPNTQEIVRRFEPAFDFVPGAAVAHGALARRLVWQPTRAWALLMGLCALACLLSLSRPTDFLYFQF